MVDWKDHFKQSKITLLIKDAKYFQTLQGHKQHYQTEYRKQPKIWIMFNQVQWIGMAKNKIAQCTTK